MTQRAATTVPDPAPVTKPTTCQHCGEPLQEPNATGRPRRFCSNACRQRAYVRRVGVAIAAPTRYECVNGCGAGINAADVTYSDVGHLCPKTRRFARFTPKDTTDG